MDNRTQIEQHLTDVENALEVLERQATESANVCLESRIAHEAVIERQGIVFDGINAQKAVLEQTKNRLLATAKKTGGN